LSYFTERDSRSSKSLSRQARQQRLPCQQQYFGAVDHRFALSGPALLSAQDKIPLQLRLPDLRLHQFQIDHGRGLTGSRTRLPGRDLVRLHVEKLANSATVFSALIAASAAFASKPGLRVRRFVIFAPDPRQ